MHIEEVDIDVGMIVCIRLMHRLQSSIKVGNVIVQVTNSDFGGCVCAVQWWDGEE